MTTNIGSKDALLVVDVQKDFCPGGALGVEEGDQVVPVMNRLIEKAGRSGAVIVASRDWHPPNHVSFEDRGGPWPMHCVQGTGGAEFHPDLELPANAVILSKGMHFDRDAYSAFDGTGLAERLRESNVKRVWVGGLAQDVCVKATVLDGREEGFEVHVLRPATRPVNVEPGDGDRALEEMKKAGAVIVDEEP
jgi:nicotinamidase/pyrazinamidase